DRVALLSKVEQLLEDVLGDLAGGDHQPERTRRLELGLQLRERRRGAGLDVGVVRLHLVAALAQTLGHPGAHPAEADHPELHQIRTRTILRPSCFSERKSPSACARISRPKPNSWPGIGISTPVSSTTWTKSPVGGPPLCSCPVECR